MLIASTYPLEIVEADRWRAKNPSLQGDALDKALEGQDWDPSVESLTRFPDLLKRMSDNLDWTKDLGDAFLDQKDEVLDTVQRMRAKAYDAGDAEDDQGAGRHARGASTRRRSSASSRRTRRSSTCRVRAGRRCTAPPAAPAPYYPTMYGPTRRATSRRRACSRSAPAWRSARAVWGDCDWDNHDVYIQQLQQRREQRREQQQ